MLATSTHDSKRGEDVRARIAVISEVPGPWRDAVMRWRARSRWQVEPDRVLEYLMWQTLVGAWPIDEERARNYALKAAREARLRTSWRRPDDAYEAAIASWLAGVYADPELVTDLDRFARAIAPRGDANALAQLLIKLVAPGVPDIYQGSELAHRVLVDPDNRGAVDFALRRDRLRAIADATVDEVHNDLGLAKLWTIRRVLGLRRRQPKLFTGPYAPLHAVGPCAERVFAFCRGTGLIAIVPRLGPIDRETTLAIPDGDWRDVLADRSWRGGSAGVAELWSRFPIALLAPTFASLLT
jgi:(1->4)-alpha-D-glucan 1-alpha-D-glucosylmutase